MPLHSGKIRQNAQKYLSLQEIINSKTKDMKMNYVKMRKTNLKEKKYLNKLLIMLLLL